MKLTKEESIITRTCLLNELCRLQKIVNNNSAAETKMDVVHLETRIKNINAIIEKLK